MPKESYYRKLFFISAIWNWGVTLTFAVGYRVVFPLFGMELPVYPVFFLMFLGLCFVFGIGYYWVSTDLTHNRGIVKMGIIGKLLVFAGLLWAGISGQINFIFVGAGIVDLVFATLFIGFLKN
ncbi:MAG: hypothetical protein KJ737_27985 [Proteobacteria bacterium]|nr:hypothetical protein [Pseudomonadota bacterium]